MGVGVGIGADSGVVSIKSISNLNPYSRTAHLSTCNTALFYSVSFCSPYLIRSSTISSSSSSSISSSSASYTSSSYSFSSYFSFYSPSSYSSIIYTSPYSSYSSSHRACSSCSIYSSHSYLEVYPLPSAFIGSGSATFSVAGGTDIVEVGTSGSFVDGSGGGDNGLPVYSIGENLRDRGT